MAWGHSHTSEAYDNARHNLKGWSAERLIEAICDDHFEYLEATTDLNIDQISSSCDDMKTGLLNDWQRFKDHQVLEERAMKLVMNTGLCDNGGFHFWIDRQGYHQVSCDKED